MKATARDLRTGTHALAATVVASADEGDDDEDVVILNDDPGIQMLHDAVAKERSLKNTLRAECAVMTDACRTAMKTVQSHFKAAHKAAIAEHHRYKQEQKAKRNEAKLKAKASPSPAP